MIQPLMVNSGTTTAGLALRAVVDVSSYLARKSNSSKLRVLYTGTINKKLNCRRETARRAVSVETARNVVQICAGFHLKILAIDEIRFNALGLKIIGNGTNRQAMKILLISGVQ